MAFAIYEKIIEEEPSFLLAYNYKATLFLNMGNYESASLCFYQILKLNPNYYNAFLGVAICFDRMGDYSKALRFYKKYLKLKPRSNNIFSVHSRIDILKLKIKQNKDIKLTLL